MKKLLLAVAVSSVAVGSANAATIYEKDGFTYKLNGDFQIQMRQKVGEDERVKVDYDDLELKNYVSYDVGNDLTAFGRLDFGFKDAADTGENGSNLEEAYVGMKYGVASFSFGKQNFAGDDFGVQEAYEAPLAEDRFDEVKVSGNDTVRVDVELENVYMIATHEMNADDTDGEYYDLLVGTDIAGLSLVAAYQQAKADGAAESEDTWGVSAGYDFGIAGIAADYSVTDAENGSEPTAYNVAATFDVASTTGVAVGMQNEDGDVAGVDDVTGWYANVTYKFPEAKNVSVFAEVADTDADDVDMGYLAGLRVKF